MVHEASDLETAAGERLLQGHPVLQRRKQARVPSLGDAEGPGRGICFPRSVASGVTWRHTRPSLSSLPHPARLCPAISLAAPQEWAGAPQSYSWHLHCLRGSPAPCSSPRGSPHPSAPAGIGQTGVGLPAIPQAPGPRGQAGSRGWTGGQGLSVYLSCAHSVHPSCPRVCGLLPVPRLPCLTRYASPPEHRVSPALPHSHTFLWGLSGGVSGPCGPSSSI